MKKLLIVFLVVLLSLGVSVTAYAADAMTCTVTADTVTGKPGETVTVPIQITGNPGFTNFAVSLTWAEGLTLKSIETQNGDEAYLCGPRVSTNLQWKASETESEMGYVVCASADPVKTDGILFAATFEIEEGFTGTAAVTPAVVYIRNNEAAFSVFEEITAEVTPGAVVSAIFGDVTGDGIVEYDDVMLAYRASLEDGPELTPAQMAAVDSDGDGVIEAAEYQKIYEIYTGGNVE